MVTWYSYNTTNDISHIKILYKTEDFSRNVLRWYLFLFQGQFFSGNDQRIYLLGNPIIWWGNLGFLAAFLLLYLFQSIKEQRGYEDVNPTVSERKSRTLNRYLTESCLILSSNIDNLFDLAVFGCLLDGPYITFRFGQWAEFCTSTIISLLNFMLPW